MYIEVRHKKYKTVMFKGRYKSIEDVVNAGRGIDFKSVDIVVTDLGYDEDVCIENGCRYCPNSINVSDEVYYFYKDCWGAQAWYSCKLDRNMRNTDNRIPPEKCPLRESEVKL